MLKNGWLLSTVAFIVSFGLSLLMLQDFKAAFIAGLVALPATFCGAIAVNCKLRIQRKRIVTALEIEVRQMEQWAIQLYDYLSVMAAEEQRVENQINFLKRQLNYQYVQTAEQQRYKQQLEQDLIGLVEQKRILEAEVRQWETQLYHLEQQKEELDLSLRSLLSQKHNMEAELQGLDIQITDSNPTTVPVADGNLPETPPAEWTEFISQLTNSELQVLTAIVELENPNPEIKKIAESYITMPELLIDAINERAIATIGDIIIESGSGSPVIGEAEYLANIREILKLNE